MPTSRGAATQSSATGADQLNLPRPSRASAPLPLMSKYQMKKGQEKKKKKKKKTADKKSGRPCALQRPSAPRMERKKYMQMEHGESLEIDMDSCYLVDFCSHLFSIEPR